MTLLASYQVSVKPMVGALWVPDVSGVGVIGNVDGGCCFWAWVRVRGVFGLLLALVMIFVIWRRRCWVAIPGGV